MSTATRWSRELIREKIRAIVKDPETAEALSPHDHPFGAKRPCLDTNYYATYNRPNVTLVNLRQEPIESITATGIKTGKRNFDVDVIVFATGFDAMTGAIMAVHPITGRGGKSLSDVWAARAADLSRPHGRGLPQLLHDHRPRQPVGAVEHGGVDRAARRLGRRPADRDATRPASPRSRRPKRRRPAGRGTWPTARR